MKKSRKSFLLAMMAILVAAGLAGCGRGNSASGQQTENANGQTDQLAQAQTEAPGSIISREMESSGLRRLHR